MIYLKNRRINTRISIVMLGSGWLGGLEVVVHVVHVVGSVPVAHPVVSVPVAAVSPVGVAVGLVPGIGLSLGLGLSGPLVVEGSVLGVAGSVPVVHVPVVAVHVPVVVAHGPVVSPVGVAVGTVPSISIGLSSCESSKTHHDGNLDHCSSI